MRRRTTSLSARRRQVPAALLAAFLLTMGTACSWGDDGASGGDAAQTDSAEGQDTDSDGGDTDTDTDGEDTDGNGGQPSPIRVSRATEQIGNQVPVGVVADQAAADMATECSGGELCVEIDLEPDDPTCQYAGAEPAAGELIDVGATLTLFGNCDIHLEPDPNQEGSYIIVGEGTESTDGTEGTDGTESTDGTEGTDGTESTDGTDG